MPVQKGDTECVKHTVVELAFSVLRESKMPKAQACATAGYVLIRSEKTPVVIKSALELWNGYMIKNLNHLLVFVKEC
jgi:hypothetical protein